jgi:hypothetical protein
MIHGSSRRLLQSIAASFGGCLVWWVGVLQSFFTVHNKCDCYNRPSLKYRVLKKLKSKKKIETSSKFPFESKKSSRMHQSVCVYDFYRYTQ